MIDLGKFKFVLVAATTYTGLVRAADVVTKYEEALVDVAKVLPCPLNLTKINKDLMELEGGFSVKTDLLNKYRNILLSGVGGDPAVVWKQLLIRSCF